MYVLYIWLCPHIWVLLNSNAGYSWNLDTLNFICSIIISFSWFALSISAKFYQVLHWTELFSLCNWTNPLFPKLWIVNGGCWWATIQVFVSSMVIHVSKLIDGESILEGIEMKLLCIKISFADNVFLLRLLILGVQKASVVLAAFIGGWVFLHAKVCNWRFWLKWLTEFYHAGE